VVLQEPTIINVINEIKDHFDNRLSRLVAANFEYGNIGTNEKSYTVSIKLPASSRISNKQFLLIDKEANVQDILDRVYLMIDGDVSPNKYLEQWILRDMETLEHLVIREISSRVPAQAIFLAGSKWEVVKLTSPYSATDRLAYK
jgi:hypothetical protein